ncbi:hypothetical protein AAur_1645 [Paenarthrobacter aurescens TC1]|uniref:Uncharacterized protein n=1 Tax=Paenarthrobacter aurescens (strain TC1) TaxID=290340 RepID=A1R599_PAEAT|nr:hypothetical protein AAur_1645 [Paenarthrobacter aurescens TC1]
MKPITPPNPHTKTTKTPNPTTAVEHPTNPRDVRERRLQTRGM